MLPVPRVALPVALCIGVTAILHDLPAQGAPQAATRASRPTAAFVTRLGRDTTVVERFTRTGDSYSVEQVLHAPRTSLRHTHLELTPRGDIGTIFLMHHRIGAPVDAPLLASTKLTYPGADSATVETRRADTLQSRRVSARRGMIPSLAQSWLPNEIAATRMRAARSDSMTVALLSASGDSTPVVVRRVGADSMTFTLPFLVYRAHVDPEGRILHLYQPRGTAVERVHDVDVNAIASAWSEADAQGRAMGSLSPLDSVSSTVGGARVSVRYSRPRTRGRTIFGEIVPWDTVWRTGANAATVFTTDRDLVVGSATLPAGSYTLFTIPSRAGTTLILNRETMRNGQPLAGTDHDPSQDMARVAMTTTTLPSPVEPLTIEILPRGADRGVLRLAWDRRDMTVPLRVLPR